MSSDDLISPDDRPARANLVRRIGYLRRGEPFDTGDVNEDFFEQLCKLTQNPWQPWAMAGVHLCELCRFTGTSVATYYRDRDRMHVTRPPTYQVSAVSSCVDLWIPGDGVLFACPTSVTHYIDAHAFRPPDDFVAAVLRCPPIRSMDYFKALLANGGREVFGKIDMKTQVDDPR